MEKSKVILVDDEKIIRNGLRRFIDWESFGLEVVEDFDDGDKAIEYIKSNEVDLIITDIKMVRQSGLDVAKYVFEKAYAAKVILLSGYREFDYAQQAIQYGVRHYLLKPFDEDEINKVLKEICAEIQQEKERKKQAERLGNYYKEAIPQMRQEFFSDLYLGMMRSKTQFERRLQLAGLENYKDHSCCLLDVTIKNYEKSLQKYDFGKERLKQEIVTFIRDSQSEEYYVVYSRSEKIKVLIFSETVHLQKDGSWKNEIQKMSEDILRLIDVELDVEVDETFSSLYEMMEYRKKQKTGQTASERSKRCGISKEDYEMLQEQFRILISNLFSGETAQIDECFEAIEAEVSDLPFHQYTELYAELLSLAEKRFMQSQEHAELAIQLEKQSDLQAMDDKAQVKEYVHKKMMELLHLLQSDTNKSTRDIVQKIQEYINTHYQQQITVEEIAGCVYLSAPYISRIFRQIMGMTIMDYIIQVRVQKAIALMKTGKYKMYEVSEMVGYSSVQYFTRQFKAVTGFTPKQYMRSE